MPGTSLNDLWIEWLEDQLVAGTSSGQAEFFGDYNTAAVATPTADNTITNASETILAANANRRGFLVQNVHATENARVRVDGTDATTTTGIQLRPGQTLIMVKPNCPVTAIKAIREGSADTTLHVVEWV